MRLHGTPRLSKQSYLSIPHNLKHVMSQKTKDSRLMLFYAYSKSVWASPASERKKHGTILSFILHSSWFQGKANTSTIGGEAWWNLVYLICRYSFICFIWQASSSRADLHGHLLLHHAELAWHHAPVIPITDILVQPVDLHKEEVEWSTQSQHERDEDMWRVTPQGGSYVGSDPFR